MMHYRKRCRHCKTAYMYQASGGGCGNPINDDRYCPDCMIVINAALSKIDVKFHPEYIPVLPTLPHNPATMEEFDEALAKKKAEDALNPYHLNTYRVSWGTPGVTDDELTIRGVKYSKLTDTITGDTILTAQYEVTGEDEGEVTGIW